MPQHGPLQAITNGVWEVQTQVKVGGGLLLPLRMTVLQDGDGLTLISPIALDDALVKALTTLGQVRTLIAPNLMHHAYLHAAVERFPDARVWGPAGLAVRNQLATGALSKDIEMIQIEGMPRLAEVVFFHRPSKTLVVSDLVFNIPEARGMSWFLLTFVSRALGGVRQSRLLRWLTKDRSAARQSVETILMLSFDRIIPAHGDVINDDAHGQLRNALGWMLSKGT